MKADVPVLESNLLHVKHFSVPTDRLAFNEFAFLHDSIWLLLFPEDNDVRFLTEPDENVWWYDGQRVEFRTPNYAKILRIMQSQHSVTIESLREQLGINKSAVQRLLSSLKEKGYIEARDNEGGWRVLITPSL